MKKKNVLHLAIVGVLSTLLACSQNYSGGFGNEDIYSIQIFTHPFEEIGAWNRTSVSIEDEGAVFQWTENDTIGIFPTTGYQVTFPMKSGAGSQNAEFTGGGWALRSIYQYAAYYPFKYSNRSCNEVAVSFIGQTQVGNAKLNHISEFDYMATSFSVPEEGMVTFDFHHMCALVQWKIKLPEGGNFLSMSLLADEPLFVKRGVLDLSKRKPAIQPLERDTVIDLALNNVRTYRDDELLVLYMMMAPTNLVGKKYTLQLTDNSGNVSKVRLNGLNFEAGKAYAITAELPAFELGKIPVDKYEGIVVSKDKTQIILQSSIKGRSQCILADDVKNWLTLRSTENSNVGKYVLDVAENPTDSTRRGIVRVRHQDTNQIIEYAILQAGENGYAVIETNGRIPIGVITCSHNPKDENNGLFALVDKNLETYFEAETTTNLVLDWEGPYPVTVLSAEYGTVDNLSIPTNVMITVSDNGIDWQGGWGVVGGIFYEGYRTLESVSIPRLKSRFYRMTIVANMGGPTIQVSEFGLTAYSDVEI